MFYYGRQPYAYSRLIKATQLIQLDKKKLKIIKIEPVRATALKVSQKLELGHLTKLFQIAAMPTLQSNYIINIFISPITCYLPGGNKYFVH